jgi:hypothetical protein
MKIIGYKLVKQEYQNAAHFIAQIKFNHIVYELEFINRLEKAGVLDLWFEPVYEKPEIPKGSDAEKFVDFINDKEIIEIKRECSTLIVKIINKKIDFYFDTETGKYLNIGKYI